MIQGIQALLSGRNTGNEGGGGGGEKSLSYRLDGLVIFCLSSILRLKNFIHVDVLFYELLLVVSSLWPHTLNGLVM